MWGESPVGKWTLEIQNDGRSIAELKHWDLVFLGTSEKPNPSLGPAEVHQTATTEDFNKPSESASVTPVENNDISSSQAKPLSSSAANPGVPPPRLEFCAKQRSDDW